MKKENAGITMIALVITMIILLILAGVTIAILTGENGIFNKAGIAKEDTQRVSAIEQAKLDILAWQTEQLENKQSATLSDSKIQEILTGKDYVKDGKPDETSFITAEGEHIVEYSELYKKVQPEIEPEPEPEPEPTDTFDPGTLEIGTAINSEKYGWKVTGYTKTTPEFKTGVWRLFYQDSNYTYLITDELTNVTYKPSDYYTTVKKEDGNLKYQTGADVSVVGQKLNKKLLQVGTFFVESNTDKNICSTAWLTDTEADIWKQYKNADAVFAIGSPTAELYKASFDATASANGATTFSLEAGTYGYTEGTSRDQLKTEYNYGIYKKSISSDWWLASPYNYSRCVLFVDVSHSYFGYAYVDGYSFAVRPVACIPTSVFDSNYASTLVNG